MFFIGVDEDREKEFLNELKGIVLSLLRGKECSVYLFGSRARGDFRRSSDADVGVMGLDERDFLRFKCLLEDWLEDSRIPFNVDVVNLDGVSEEFLKTVLKEGIRWK